MSEGERSAHVVSGFSTLTNTAEAPATDSFIERKSEFIGAACHVDSLDEALAFVDVVRTQNPKARHVAFASIVGAAAGGANERMSDDGEPSGTAGKPILEVLDAGRLTDCVITVTRYFGGVLLGSGGLIRAYSTAASMSLKQAGIVPIVPKTGYEVTLEYSWIGRFEHILAQVGGEVRSRKFTDVVRLNVIVPVAVADLFETGVRDAFSARAKVTKSF